MPEPTRTRRRLPVSEDERRDVVQAIGRATLAAPELHERLAAGQGKSEIERIVASAVSHGYVRMRRSGNLRLYTVRPAGEPWLPKPNLRPSSVPPAITVHMSVPGNLPQSVIRSMMSDVIEEALSVRGWSV